MGPLVAFMMVPSELILKRQCRLKTLQEEILPAYLKDSVARTREILETREEAIQLRREEEEHAKKRFRYC